MLDETSEYSESTNKLHEQGAQVHSVPIHTTPQLGLHGLFL